MELVRVDRNPAAPTPQWRRLALHSAHVHAIVVHPDGEHALSSDEGGRVLLWEIDSGALVRELEGHSGPVNHLAVHGGFMASAGDDRTARVWSLRAGVEPMFVLRGHEGYVRRVALTDEYVISACDDGIVRVWSMANGRLRGALEGHGEVIQAVTVSPCGRYAVSASIEHRVLVWDLKRMKAVEPVYTGTSWVRHLGLGRLFIGGRNTSGKGHAGQAPQAMQFLDARRLVTAADDVIVWDFPARAELGRLDDFAWGVQAMARDATRVFFGTHSELRGMTSDLSAVVLRCKAPAGGVTALCLHGDRVLVGGAKGAVWVMPTAGWQPAPRHLGSASEATAAPGDALVATADSDAVIRLWDFDTGAPRACLDRYPEPNHKPFAFSSDGALLATTHHERPPCVCLWDAATGALIRELHHQDASARKHQVGALVFAGDSLLVGPFGGGTIQRWSLDGERVSSGATKTCQISKLAIVGDVVVSIGYFSVRGVDAPWSGENDSVTHLQGWSAAGELLWTHASQPAPKWQWSASFDSLHPLADGRLLTHSGRESGELALLDPRTGALLRTWKLGDDFSIVGVHEGVAIARVTKRLKRLGFDDVRIYVDPDDLDWSSSDHETRSWLARVDPDGAPTKLLDLPFGAMHLSVASAADRVAWTEDHAVVVAQLSSGRALARVELGESITSLVLRSDGARVFAGMRSGEGRVYALEGDA